MFHNMGIISNSSYQHSQHKLDTFKTIVINEVISIVGIAKVNSDWGKTPIKENIYNRTDGWFKARRISTGYIQVTTSNGLFQNGGTSIMVVDEI